MRQKDAKADTWYICLKSFGEFKQGQAYLSHWRGINSDRHYGQTAWFSDQNTYKYFRLAKENERPRITKGSYWKATKDIYYGLGKEFLKNHIYESPLNYYLYPFGSNVPCKIMDFNLSYHDFIPATTEEIKEINK